MGKSLQIDGNAVRDVRTLVLGQSQAELAERADCDERTIPYGQSLFEVSLATEGDLTSEVYLEQLEAGIRLLGEEGFDALIAEHDLDALVFSEIWSAFGAIPGYPSITVPAGYTETGEPGSIEFLAGAFSEPTLIEIAYAYEQGTQLRVPPNLIPEPAGLAMAVSAALLALLARRRR